MYGKETMASFLMFVRQIAADSMLVMSTAAPILAGTAFRFGLPPLEAFLSHRLGHPVIAPYYALVDAFLAILAPYMLCFASSMVILEERDAGIVSCLAVTPVGRIGYVASRLVIPSLIAAAVTVVVLSAFGLSGMGLRVRLAVSAASAILATSFALLIPAASRNRVEGMAIAKLCGLILAGIAVPFVVRSPWRFLAAPLPSFWVGEALSRARPFAWLAFIGVSLVWVAALYPLFCRRIERR